MTIATVTGLENGQEYEVSVAAVNAIGTGPASAPVSATPVASSTPVPLPAALSNYVLDPAGDFEFAEMTSATGKNPAGWGTSYDEQGGSSSESEANCSIVNGTGLVLTQSSSGVGDCITTSPDNGASPGYVATMPFAREVKVMCPASGGVNTNHVGSWLLSGFSGTVYEVDMVESLNDGSGTGSIWFHLHAGPTSDYQQSAGINLGYFEPDVWYTVDAEIATTGVEVFVNGVSKGTESWPGYTPPAGTTMFGLHQTDDTPSYGGPSDPGAAYSVAYDRFFKVPETVISGGDAEETGELLSGGDAATAGSAVI